MTQSVQIYINDSLIDLVPGQVVAKTIQSFDLYTPGSVKANYTNQFKALKTNNNRAILQYSDSIKSLSTYPYAPLPCRIIQNGMELVGNGSAVITSIDEFINITVYDGVFGFFSKIQNKKLWDVSTSTYDKAVVQDTDRAVSSGIVPAVYQTGGQTLGGGDITALGVMPNSIYYASLMDSIFKTFGYTYSGNVFSHAKYLALAIPFQTRYQSLFAAAKECQASGANQTIASGPLGGNQTVLFPTLSFNGSDGNFSTGSSTYIVNNLSAAGGSPVFIANFQVQLNITCTAAGTTPTFKVQIELNGVLVYTAFGPITPVVATTYKISLGATDMDSASSAISLKNGDVVRVQAYMTGTTTGNSYTVNSATFLCKVPNTVANSSIPTSGTPYLFANHLMPEMYITDFMSNFIRMFGLLTKESKGVVYFKNIDELINDTGNAVDWTSKRDMTRPGGGESIVMQFQNLAQSNVFKWLLNDGESLPEDFARGSFTIANTNLTPESVYTSPFGMSRTEVYSTIQMAKVNLISGGVFVNEMGTRLFLLRASGSFEPGVNFGSGVRNGANAYKVAYFLDAQQTYSLHWNDAINNFYSQYAIRMQRGKMVTRMYNLNDLDINNFDPFKLIYDDGAYFIVNAIYNYVPGRSTKVEMMKI